MARAKAQEVDLDEPVDTVTVLWHWLREGWKYRGFDKKLTPKQRKQYGDRVKYEMELILSKDFGDYFAVLSDIVRKAKDRGLAVGPGRGSAAASLVCYLLRLTEVNPLEYPLMLFERFIDPNRFDLPDIDVDFDDANRDMVRQIMIEIYGEDRVGNIGTFTRYRAKNSLDDVARVYGVPKSAVDIVKNFIIERSGGDARFNDSLADTVSSFPEVAAVFEEYPVLWNATKLEGNYKSFGVHAAGLVVGAEPITQYVAMYEKQNVGQENKTLAVLSVDKYDGESLGLMKLDALGLSTMGMIADCLKMVGMTLEELYEIPMDDPETIAAFQRADVVGIFQFEGRATAQLTEQLKPDKFMDLVALNALSRPGPLHSGSAGDFIQVRQGHMPKTDLGPIVNKITEATEGQIIYQEQILQITRDVGQFPWTHAGKIRKIISSKQGESAFNAMWDDFKKGAATVGVPEPLAVEIWKRMATAGTYAFNIAHCVSYSMLAVWSMYLKVHHPAEFYASQLNKVGEGNDDKANALMRDMSNPKFGRTLKVLPPAPGVSGVSWTPVPEGVRAGFRQIPGIGAKMAAVVQEYDDAVGIKDWDDLITVRGIGPGTIKKIRKFADDPDPFKIQKVTDDLVAIRAAIRSGDLPGLPVPKHNSDTIPYELSKKDYVVVGRLDSTNLKDLYEFHRSRYGEDLDPSTVRDPEKTASMSLYMRDEFGPLTVAVDRWVYPQYERALWGARKGVDYILLVGEKYPFPGSKMLRAKSLWVIKGED